MTPQQTALARHALGLPNYARRSYRNRFLTHEGGRDHGVWMSMVDSGLAERAVTPNGYGGADFFSLTPAGAKAALMPRETLDPEDFPETQETDASRAGRLAKALELAAAKRDEMEAKRDHWWRIAEQRGDMLDKMSAENAALRADVAKLREAAEKGAKQFRWYESLHRAKPDHEKADRNMIFAEALEAALAATKLEEPGE